MMQIEGVAIEDTFAEAFGMRATRLVITAASRTWARHAAVAATGFATSVIACGCEAAIERDLAPRETPDGRPGVAVLLFAISQELQKQVERRTGQCVLTCATTAAYGGIAADAVHEWLGLGRSLRYFGDGFQISKLIDGRRYWRIPVMDGEFVCEDRIGLVKGIGGGNFLILARDAAAALAAAERAVAAMRRVRDVILPFPAASCDRIRSARSTGRCRHRPTSAAPPAQAPLAPAGQCGSGAGDRHRWSRRPASARDGRRDPGRLRARRRARRRGSTCQNYGGSSGAPFPARDGVNADVRLRCVRRQNRRNAASPPRAKVRAEIGRLGGWNEPSPSARCSRSAARTRAGSFSRACRGRSCASARASMGASSPSSGSRGITLASR
jgi:formylmethanofuran--tetrahydromethanopterin N-formyltransferase